MTGISSDPRHARIAWRCRRGMRELDLLLERFLAEGLDALGETQLDALERLLDRPDQDILAWLTQASGPDDDTLRAIVAIARERIHGRASTNE